MCAILDTDASHEVFTKQQHEAGQRFLRWINSKPKRLVVGGQMLREINKTPARLLIAEGIRSARIRRENDAKVDEKEEELRQSIVLKSNDYHVIALAIVSGARLLYSNDKDLHKDFKNHKLIRNPRGKVYSTDCKGSFTGTHKRLLQTKDLCRDGCTNPQSPK
ncbi:MAG: type II toxin-antitoxin system VapC family toxin [Chloroflexi bacterium]|nr:type II toxin-antitoxin system VapC family toxin [Chloroflexota bacterium]